MEDAELLVIADELARYMVEVLGGGSCGQPFIYQGNVEFPSLGIDKRNCGVPTHHIEKLAFEVEGLRGEERVRVLRSHATQHLLDAGLLLRWVDENR